MLNRKLEKLKNQRNSKSTLLQFAERSARGNVIGFDLQNEDLTASGCDLEAEIIPFEIQPYQFFCTHDWDAVMRACKKCGITMELHHDRTRKLL